MNISDPDRGAIDIRSSEDASRRTRRSGKRFSIVALAVAAAGSALLAAGCGGGSSGAQVAQVGTTSSAASRSSSSGSSGRGNPTAFSACMRRNGVPNFPDPDSNGRIRITGGRDASGRTFGVETDSPQFRKAQRACRKLQPNSGKLSPEEQAREQQKALEFARCMRSNGVPKFPDPRFAPNGGTLLRIGKGVNPDSPQFKAAQKACQKLVPGGPVAKSPTGEP
jgi:hypothetical protein